MIQVDSPKEAATEGGALSRSPRWERARAAFLHPNVMAAVLAIVSIAVFSPSITGQFVWDDMNNLGNNTRLREWGNILDVFRNSAMWSAEKDVGLVGTYRPLSLASFVVDFKVWGGQPWGYHLTNLFLHAAAVLAIFGFLRRIFESDVAGFWGALVCAVHPAGVEAIGWINGRSEPIATFFGVSALCFCLARGRAWWIHVAGYSGCLLLSMLGKETGAVFVLLGTLMVLSRRRTLARRQFLFFLAGAAVAPAVYWLLRRSALGDAVMPQIPEMVFMVPLALGPLWFRGLQSAFIPLDRGIIMAGGWAKANTPFENLSYIFLSVVLVALVLYAFAKRRHLLALGMAWFLVALSPAAMLMILGWPGFTRWIYITLPGLVIATRELALLRPIGFVHRHWTKLLLGLTVAFVILVQLAIPVWNNNVALYSRAIVENPRDSYGNTSLGYTLFSQKEFASAEIFFRRALKINPDDANASTGLSMELSRRGECREAQLMYESHLQSHNPPAEFVRLYRGCREGQIQEVRE